MTQKEQAKLKKAIEHFNEADGLGWHDGMCILLDLLNPPAPKARKKREPVPSTWFADWERAIKETSKR